MIIKGLIVKLFAFISMINQKTYKNLTIFIFAYINTIIIFTLALGVLMLFSLLNISKTNIDFTKIFYPFLFSLATGVWEEVVFRYYFFGKLYSKTKLFWNSCVLSSIVFSLCHFPYVGYNFISFLSYFVGGVVYCIVFNKSKNILFPIAIHSAWNFSQFIFSITMSNEKNNGLFKVVFPNKNLWFFGNYGIENGVLSIVLRLIILVSSYVLIVNWRKYFKIEN